MEWLRSALDFLRRLTDPQSLNVMAGDLNGWLYGVLVAIIFCRASAKASVFSRSGIEPLFVTSYSSMIFPTGRNSAQFSHQ